MARVPTTCVGIMIRPIRNASKLAARVATGLVARRRRVENPQHVFLCAPASVSAWRIASVCMRGCDTVTADPRLWVCLRLARCLHATQA
eukprot:1330192-Rhodomonas_salina.2